MAFEYIIVSADTGLGSSPSEIKASDGTQQISGTISLMYQAAAHQFEDSSEANTLFT